MSIKVWKHADPKSPSFPSDYVVKKKATLQKTSLGDNNNKYYGLELHEAGHQFRVFTHYGRTDDLSSNSNAGVKECRYFESAQDAEKEYARIFKEKTGKSKGYSEVSLASSNIGSDKAKGQSSGRIDEKTAAKVERPTAVAHPVHVCPPAISSLISMIYGEATDALVNTVQAKITAKGIETPLGVLTIGQIELGQALLKQLFDAIKAKESKKGLEAFTSSFYTAIPHKLGRAKEAIQSAIIDTLGKVSEKEETLQLMRDMLKVDGEAHDTLVSDDLGAKYKALDCALELIPHGTPVHEELSAFIRKARIKRGPVTVKNFYAVRQLSSWITTEAPKPVVNTNERRLFHGSRIKNWVGLLSRGVLMPKLVVAMGVNRTDGGWLGNGIYFGDVTCTSSYYTSPARNGHRLMSIHTVALGRMKDFDRITYGMNAPPEGYDSCHGVRGTQFADDEYCIYNPNQQVMQYLMEFV